MWQRLARLRGGVPLALGAAVLFGLSAPVAKALLTNISPAMLAGLFYLGSGGGLSETRVVRPGGAAAREAPRRRADVPWLVAMVAAGGTLGPLLLTAGLAGTPAATASLLLNLEGVFTLSIAWVVFHLNVDLRVGAGAPAILLAAGLLSWTRGPAALQSA